MGLPARTAALLFVAALAPGCSGGGERERLSELTRELAQAGFAVDLDRIGLRSATRAQALEVFDRLDRELHDPAHFELMWTLHGALGLDVGDSPDEFRARILDDSAWTFAAFYDQGRGELVRIDSPAGAFGSTDFVLLHELAHAWQDQRRPLSGFQAEVRDCFDRLKVRQLLVEGQAEAIALTVLIAREGESLRGRDMETMDAEYTRGPGAVGSVYDLGRRYVLERDRAQPGFLGRALDAPPASSEQLLHLAKLGADEPAELEPAAWPEDWPAAELVREDTFGEHGLYGFLLDAGLAEAEAWVAAIGWDGDRLQLWRSGDQRLLVWRLLFDRELDAEQFAAAWPPRPDVGLRRAGRVVAWVRADDAERVEEMLSRLCALPVPAAEPADAASTATAEARWLAESGR